MSAAEILEQFRRLPFEERYEVVQRLNEELEDELAPEQIAEFEQRAERLCRNPEQGIPWEKVTAELKERRNKKGLEVVIAAVCRASGGNGEVLDETKSVSLRDANDQKWIAQSLPVHDQVQELINLATSPAMFMRQWQMAHYWL